MKKRFLIINSQMWVEINRYFNGFRKWGDDLIDFKIKNLFEKELVIILDKNYLDNYWYMYIIQNPGSLFNQNMKINNKVFTSKTGSDISIHYFSSANKPIHPKLTNKQFATLVNGTIKKFLQNIFYLVTEHRQSINDCLIDSSSFAMGVFNTKLNELGFARIIDSGVTIAAVLQKITKRDNFTNSNLTRVDYSQVVKKEFCISLRELIYNKMLEIYNNTKLEGYGSNIKGLDNNKSLNTKNKAKIIFYENKEIKTNFQRENDYFSNTPKAKLNKILLPLNELQSNGGNFEHNSPKSLIIYDKLNRNSVLSKNKNKDSDENIVSTSGLEPEKNSNSGTSFNEQNVLNDNNKIISIKKTEKENITSYSPIPFTDTKPNRINKIDLRSISEKYTPNPDQECISPRSSNKSKISELKVQLEFEEKLLKEQNNDTHEDDKVGNTYRTNKGGCCNVDKCILY